MLQRASVVFWVALCFSAESHRLQHALELQRAGKLREARAVLTTAIKELQNGAEIATAWTARSRISIQLGEYETAIDEARHAIDVRGALGDDAALGEDFNTVGLANQYLGNYPAALENYQQALQLDRVHADTEGYITLLNNIGNIYYFEGRYGDALRSYEQAREKVEVTTKEPWNPWRRQLTLANLATLYQRLGQEQIALEYYRELTREPDALPKQEYAQLLLNEGVLYRRMGDPVKALELYRNAQALFAASRHPDGEIGALRNIGIVQAVDLDNLPPALQAFSAALRLASESRNTRGQVQAHLYRGETLRRLHNLAEARQDCDAALAGARAAGLIEEEWKALHALGGIAEEEGRPADARAIYAKAIGVIESVRTGLRVAALRSDFLADKRDVYDAAIRLMLRQSPVPAAEIFQTLESSRARTLSERLASRLPKSPPGLDAVRAKLPAGTVLVEYWMAGDTATAVWVSSASAHVVQLASSPAHIGELAAQLTASIAGSSPNWPDAARSLGAVLLAGVPVAQHLLVVADGPLNLVPFEALFAPSASAPLIETADVAYLPAARFLDLRQTGRTGRLLPWKRQLVAFGAPPISAADRLSDRQWAPLPASESEVRNIASLMNGRSETHLGPDARKLYLAGGRAAGTPLLHFSTHALVDVENPDRSRILLSASDGGYDYLFQQEVYDLDLTGVDLVTLSACDTARGKLVRGEGIAAFSQAFLAAGAAAAVTSLWRVADQPSAEFMQQFYYFLAQGESKAAALRSAKLRFLHSGTELANPRHWAAFVLTGDGAEPPARAIAWSTAAWVAALLLLAVAALLRSVYGRDRTAANGAKAAVASSPANPNA